LENPSWVSLSLTCHYAGIKIYESPIQKEK
jgi:hypothetical protein